MTNDAVKLIAGAAFILGFAAPIAAWRYSTSCYDCSGPWGDKDVNLMSDGTPMSGNGVWDGHLAYPIERFFFYVRHPFAPRPSGNGRLWIYEQREKWTKPILVSCSLKDGSCVTHMPPNDLKRPTS